MPCLCKSRVELRILSLHPRRVQGIAPAHITRCLDIQHFGFRFNGVQLFGKALVYHHKGFARTLSLHLPILDTLIVSFISHYMLQFQPFPGHK